MGRLLQPRRASSAQVCRRHRVAGHDYLQPARVGVPVRRVGSGVGMCFQPRPIDCLLRKAPPPSCLSQSCPTDETLAGGGADKWKDWLRARVPEAAAAHRGEPWTPRRSPKRRCAHTLAMRHGLHAPPVAQRFSGRQSGSAAAPPLLSDPPLRAVLLTCAPAWSAQARAKFGNLKAHPNPAQRIMKGSERKCVRAATPCGDAPAHARRACRG
jgi:hypothetical protein